MAARLSGRNIRLLGYTGHAQTFGSVIKPNIKYPLLEVIIKITLHFKTKFAILITDSKIVRNRLKL